MHMDKILFCHAAAWLIFAGSAMGAETPAVSEKALTNGNPSVSLMERKQAMKEHQSGEWTPDLTAVEKKTLLAIARDTLEWCVRGAGHPFPMETYTITDALRRDMATFVTLKIGGELRGCIGSLSPEESLYQSVHHNAVNAALRDPRFQPVAPSELGRIRLDVSILSPIRDISSLAEFKVGKQGIILSKSGRRAVFLPEVAVEQGWSMEETLTHLSRKAGLPAEAWRKDASFQVFESYVLSE
jgi:AmmeMemoRadiSam system protein A